MTAIGLFLVAAVFYLLGVQAGKSLQRQKYNEAMRRSNKIMQIPR